MSQGIIYQTNCADFKTCTHASTCELARPRRREGTRFGKGWGVKAADFFCPVDRAKKVEFIISRCSGRKNEYIRWQLISHPQLFGYGTPERIREQMKQFGNKFNKAYGVFRRNLKGPQVYEGRVECSFSMSWDETRVTLETLAGAQEVLKENQKRCREAGYEMFIVKLTATGKNNPFIIDWNASKDRKYTWRNIPFRLKGSTTKSLPMTSEVLAEMDNPVF
jgi:hypothetical protein